MQQRCLTVLALLFSFSVTSHTLLGDDGVVSRPAIVVEAEVPSVFSKPVPEGVSDLRAIETHVSQLARRVRPCTVGLRIESAKGSGVIVSEDGYVLTAAHVSNRIDRNVEIILSTGETVRGISLGADRTMDAGLIKINDPAHPGRKWPAATVADSDKVKRGNWCLVASHPSGPAARPVAEVRLGRVAMATPWVVQSDCELVGGDSGGPLYDMSGRVIGINSRIKESTNDNFHIPANIWRRDWDRLTAGKVFQSGTGLGVSGEPVSEGLRITNIRKGEPADISGLKPGDILVTFETQRVSTLDELVRLLNQERPGKQATLEILRSGKTAAVVVELSLGRN
jgi:serine protease Do